MVATEQLKFDFEDVEFDDIQVVKKNTSSTFLDNMSLPIHRWFRYSAGFSALWARKLIMQEKLKGRLKVFDPFAGSGTILLEGEHCNVEVTGIEAHPFVSRVARAKLYWRVNPKTFLDYALSILEQAKKQTANIDNYPKLVRKCFLPESLAQLDSLRTAWTKASKDSLPISELTWLALTSILRECSNVGTAQWQYILPSKTKVRVVDPYKAFEAKVYLMAEDMTKRQKQVFGQEAVLHCEDARECPSVPDKSIDLIITSPPYANNYDYADATRLEMSFYGEIQNWGDLQDAVRKYLIRSCTQHVACMNGETYKLINNELLVPIRKEINEVCRQLEAERERHGGKKPYHTMVAAYFYDMAKVWVSLRRIAKEGSLICFVVGDSAPYGIYVPVDKWLGELAIGAGFRSYYFEKMRDRNVKWKNRKHRVPLHEGCLWIEG